VVDVYALTNPQHTPWQVPSRVLFHDVACAPCYRSVCPEGHHQCLEGVPPERVVAAALTLMHRRPSGGSKEPALARASIGASSRPRVVDVHGAVGAALGGTAAAAGSAAVGAPARWASRRSKRASDE